MNRFDFANILKPTTLNGWRRIGPTTYGYKNVRVEKNSGNNWYCVRIFSHRNDIEVVNYSMEWPEIEVAMNYAKNYLIAKDWPNEKI